MQELNVIYDNDITRCHICHCVHESNGCMISMSACKHTFHISCLIDYVNIDTMFCPECNEVFTDIRLSLAVACKRGDIQSFVNILSHTGDEI
jgi:hypothetical protein